MGKVREVVGRDAVITGVLYLDDLDSFALATEKQVYLWKRTELFSGANTISTEHDVCLLAYSAPFSCLIVFADCFVRRLFVGLDESCSGAHVGDVL